MHGARGGGPRPGNKNAVTTGEYETIWLDQLDDTERVLFDQIALDVIKQIDDEIRLITIRERRMLQRIARLSEQDRTTTSFVHEQGLGPRGPVDLTTVTQTDSLGQIQRIEEALTRVQAQKARLLDLKHKIESGHGPDEPEIEQYLQAFSKAAVYAWSDQETDEGSDADADA